MLVGNWGKDNDDYNGGTHPTKWIGSMAIIQSYYHKKRPVKYAQCWIYAGVLTTCKYELIEVVMNQLTKKKRNNLTEQNFVWEIDTYWRRYVTIILRL